MSASWRIVEAGALVTVQDRGRPGLAHLGVPRAGWLDPVAAALGNRLVGNDEDAAVLEIAGGGLSLTQRGGGRWVAATGASCEVRVDGVVRGHSTAVWVPAGARLTLGPALTGVRTYLAVGGGISVPAVLGSRSTDTLSWVGPAPISHGVLVPLGDRLGRPAALDVSVPAARGALRVGPGPRADWFSGEALARLFSQDYAVTASSNRVGLRLSGPALARVRSGELPSEGMVLGAVQVPPDGAPVVLLADHPTTGGYPVIGVVTREDVGRCAQLRAGDPVRFAPA